MRLRFALPFCALFSVMLSGCQVGYFHARTTWNADGSIDRDLLQPKGIMAHGVESGQGWAMTRSVDGPDAEYRGAIVDLPEDVDGQYFAGSVSRPDVASLPGHYRKEAKDEQFESRLVRKAARVDYGLVVDYVWDETLTEIVELHGLRRAINEIVDMAAEGMPVILSQSLEVECDTSRLHEWIDAEGREWVQELIDVIYDDAVRRSDDDTATLAALSDICQRHGLDVEFGEAWDKSDEDRSQQFLIDLLNTTVRKPDGSELDGVDVDRMRHFIVGSDKAIHDAFEQKLNKASDDYKKNWPGGEKAFDVKMNNLGTRILGVHGLIFGSPEQFRYRMTVPGEIVETNGNLLTGSSVEWEFSLDDVWPAGYSMRLRSLDDHTSKLTGSLTKNFRPTRANLMRVVDAIGDDAQLRDALQQCREQQSDAPLRLLADNLPEESDTHPRIEALRQLLNWIED